ncbi:MAG: winged helix-turn-helix transcriptional regulator [Candidatus Aenigmarchaeota archaeon]|nr:winged helix-turn-helix transcriptional regulator [Candidatus Aenigmarchaeota archaeon]
MSEEGNDARGVNTLDKQSLKALGAETRQEIIKLLTQRPYTASELSKKLNKHVTTISEHLSMLESSGLVEKKDDGHKWLYYSLTAKGERLTKPKYYAWTIMLVLSGVAILGGIVDIFSYNSSALARESAQTAYGAGAAPATFPDGIWLILAGIIFVAIAAFLKMRNK